MLHRALPDPIPPADADVDTDAMAESVSNIERGERHLKMLAELGEIGMNLARSLSELTQARIERELKGEDGPARSEAAAAAFDKMAQTVRRTVALEARLAEGVKAHRAGLITQRAERRVARNADHENAVVDAIIGGLHDAYAADCPDTEFHDLADRLMDDAREYLEDADEMRGYLDRPVGETVAKLCAAMGLDPDACELHDGAWRIRRPLLDFELRLEERARKYPSSLPRSGEEQIAKRSEWGAAGKPPDTEVAAAPHSGCSASCPSP